MRAYVWNDEDECVQLSHPCKRIHKYIASNLYVLVYKFN